MNGYQLLKPLLWKSTTPGGTAAQTAPLNLGFASSTQASWRSMLRPLGSVMSCKRPAGGVGASLLPRSRSQNEGLAPRGARLSMAATGGHGMDAMALAAAAATWRCCQTRCHMASWTWRMGCEALSKMACTKMATGRTSLRGHLLTGLRAHWLAHLRAYKFIKLFAHQFRAY